MDLTTLFGLGLTKQYALDAFFFFQGDPGREMFILLDGAAGVFLENVDGSQVLVATLGPGDFFGEMSLLEETPRTASVQAMKDCVVLELSEEDFHRLVQEYPTFALAMLKTLSGRIRQLNQEVMDKEQKETSPLKFSQTLVVDKGLCVRYLKERLKEEASRFSQMLAPQTHQKYVFANEVSCPACDQAIVMRTIRTSRLQLVAVDPDLRERYQDFDPLWYRIWICPFCAYASFFSEFRQLDLGRMAFTREHIASIKGEFGLGYSNPRTAYEVLDAHLYLLHLEEQCSENTQGVAKVWLSLFWLYQDLREDQLARFAGSRALYYLKETYPHTRRNALTNQDARVFLVMGELALLLGRIDDAAKSFEYVQSCESDGELVHRARSRMKELDRLGAL